jgi:hypothetical protein
MVPIAMHLVVQILLQVVAVQAAVVRGDQSILHIYESADRGYNLSALREASALTVALFLVESIKQVVAVLAGPVVALMGSAALG